MKKMPKRKSLKTVEAQIDAVKVKIENAKARYDRLCAELVSLQKEREEAMGKEVLKALKSSGKSYRELMIFLGK